MTGDHGSSEDLVGAVQELTQVLQRHRTLGMALAQITETATASVPACDAASVAISIEGRPATAAASARIALEIDLLQYDTADGPCLTSFRTASALRVDLVEAEDDFPHLAVAARQQGIRSVLSLPAMWGSELVGTLNLYSRTASFDQTAESIGGVLAGQVGIAISRSPEFAAARGVLEQAQRDADDRTVVALATGLLMAYQSCTVEQAEALLSRSAAQDQGTILEIAHRIVENNSTFR